MNYFDWDFTRFQLVKHFEQAITELERMRFPSNVTDEAHTTVIVPFKYMHLHEQANLLAEKIAKISEINFTDNQQQALLTQCKEALFKRYWQRNPINRIK